MHRRSFMVGAAAAAVISAAPAAALQTKEPIKIGLDGGAGDDITSFWWGYSTDGNHWHGTYITRDEVMNAARANAFSGSFKIGKCYPRQLTMPELHEDVVNWLAGDSKDTDLESMIIDSFDGSNEDNDFEGEVRDALVNADIKWIVDETQQAIEASFRRLGRQDLVARLMDWENVDGPIVDDEKVLSELENDRAFKAWLEGAASLWVLNEKLLHVPMRLDVTDEEEVHA